MKSKTTNEQFWEWISQCPDQVYVNHDYSDDEACETTYVFGFVVPKTFNYGSKDNGTY